MKSERYSKFLAGLVTSLILFSLVISPALAAAGDTTRVSVASDGTQGNDWSDYPSISADGRYVAFESAASNLVSGDTNGTWDVFVHDRQSGGTERVSVASDGTQGSYHSFAPSISANGCYVAFVSFADNLVSGDTNGYGDVFVHDRQSGGTTRVSLATDGSQGDSSSLGTFISADGRYVAFESFASNLVSGDTNDYIDVFVHDRQGGGTTRVSVASDGAQGNGGSDYSSISADGRYVTFRSWASNLVSGDTNDTGDIFVHDRQSGGTMRVSVASDGAQGNGGSDYSSISADGRYVAFESYATNLVSGDTNGYIDVFVHDRQGGGTTLVSVASDGTQGDGDSCSTYACHPSISADGRYVAFYSWASNLVSGDTNGYGDVFIHDRQNGGTERISVASDGAQGNSDSCLPYVCLPSISADGRYVAFVSFADNLVSGDTNGAGDVFVHENDVVPTYSISGRVVDSSSNSMAGVSVSGGTGHTTSTDSSGNYTLSGFTPGVYAITPSKSGYTFNPISRAIYIVNGNMTGVDFTGTIVPPTGKPVVVLVHGWMGLGTQVYCSEWITLYPDNQNFDGENGDTLGDLPDWLNSQGFEVWSAHLTTGPDQTDSLRSNALCLRDQIAQVRSRAPDGKVIVIAHSMGGLVSRAYIEDNELYQNDVKTLITLGSPHQGVPVPWWDAVKRLMGFFKGWNCDNQAAVCEFTAGIDQFNQQHSIRRPGVEYYTVSGDLSFFDATWLSRLLSAAIPGADDGGVPQTSGNGLSGSHQTLATNEAHIKDFGLFSYFGPPPGDLYSFAYADCIQPVLAGNPDGCHAFASQATAATATPLFSALSPIVEGTVLSGQLVTHTLGMDGSGSALFAASWPTGDITFTLKSPSGQIIDPAYALAHPDQVNYLQSDAGQTPLGATYAITSAEAGLWTMNLQAGSIPGGSTSYALLAAMESPITLTAQTDRDWYIPGASATLTATLGGSPSSATVTANILRVDGVTDTLPLSSIGNGQYQASYTVPAAPGYAEVRLVATGTTASSLSFERGTSLVFQISPNTFILNNTYSDALAAPDLNVTVGINAAVSGKVGLSADLVDGSGNFVAHALTIQDVVAGTTTLTLQFNGADIFASQRNGPYTLTNVLLTDESGATLVT